MSLKHTLQDAIIRVKKLEEAADGIDPPEGVAAELLDAKTWLDAIVKMAKSEALDDIADFTKELTSAFQGTTRQGSSGTLKINPERATLLSKVFEDMSLVPQNLEVALLIKQDWDRLKVLMPIDGSHASIVVHGHKLELDRYSRYELLKNYSTGLARGNKIHFSRYAHNPHTLANVVQHMDSLLGELRDVVPDFNKLKPRIAVEGIMDEVSSIPDVVVYLDDLNWVSKRIGSDGVEEIIPIFGKGEIPTIPVTFDSKYVGKGSNIGSKKTIKQQTQQAMADRSRVVEAALDNLLGASYSAKESVELISQSFPFIFQHYVVTPRNIIPSDATNLKFIEAANELAEELCGPVLNARGVQKGDEAYDSFFTTLTDHNQDWFGSGKYLYPSDIPHIKGEVI